MNSKRKGVVFNLDNPDEKELYDFCSEKTNNFSGFVKKIIFLYKEGKITHVNSQSSSKENYNDKAPTSSKDDKDFMRDLF